MFYYALEKVFMTGTAFLKKLAASCAVTMLLAMANVAQAQTSTVTIPVSYGASSSFDRFQHEGVNSSGSSPVFFPAPTGWESLGLVPESGTIAMSLLVGSSLARLMVRRRKRK